MRIVFLIWLALLILLYQSHAAIVQVQSVLSNQNAGELSDYRFTINRSISATGATIVPASLTSNFSIDIEFGPNYDLSSALPSSGSYASSSIDSNNFIVKLNYANTSLTTPIFFTLSNITNPLVTSIYQPISIKIRNSSLLIIDQADLSLLYNSSTLSQISSWNPAFVPGNVSTVSNFEFNFVPDVWKNGKMVLTLAFSKYWTRSLQNTSATTIITSSTKCEPTCTISSKATFTQVQFSGLNINASSGSVPIKILNILSPPSVQKVDIVSVSTYDSLYSSMIETGSFLAFSSRPNLLQNLIVETTSKIQEPITLSLQITTMNIFGPNDTITLNLAQEIIPSSINITLSNGIVPSYNFDLLSSKEIMFSGFTILSSTYSRMSFTINIQNGLKPVRSTKPIQNNQISIKRNGFLYNQQSFSFTVLPSINQVPIQVTTSNNFVNFNATLSLSVSNLTENFLPTDTLQFILPQEIKLYGNSCYPIQCVGCLCSMMIANDSSTQSVITLSNFPVGGLTSVSLNLQAKNPITGGQVISMCHFDSENYTIECLNGSYPSVKESTLGSRTISFESSSDTVYESATYTVTINLTEYALSQGYMLIYFQKRLYLVNTSIAICYVNGEPLCELGSYTTSEQIVIRVNVVDTSVKVYTVRVENVRNPLSTQPFQFSIKVFTVLVSNGSSSDLLYYQAESTYYSLSKPFKLNNVQPSLFPCRNSQPSTLTLTFPNGSLPFSPVSGILIDNPQPSSTPILLRTTNQQTLWNSSMINIPVQNYMSLESVRYSFLLKTLDLLYDIFSFEIVAKTCEASNLVIDSWKVTGLLGDAGHVTLVYGNLLPIDFMLVQFPIEYSSNISVLSNAVSTTRVSPRTFKLVLTRIQPVSIQLWNFTHSAIKSSYFRISTFKTSSIDNKDYLVEENSNTIMYDLTTTSSCTFPCKICSSSNSSVCLECYSKEWTENYLLVNGTCTSVCQTGFYLSIIDQNCKRCNLTCLTCDQTKCFTCVQYYYYLNGSCLTDCPAKYFPISLNQTCSSCLYPCDKCVNSTTCLTCQTPFYLTLNGKCLTSCQPNEYPINQVCRKCQIPCETCSQQLNNCTKCITGFYFNSGSCLTLCPSPLVPSTINNNNICTSCVSPCLTCTLSPNDCTSCVSSFKLYQQNCITTCLQSFFQSMSVCIPCPAECLICSSLVICSVCAKGYKLYSSRCVSICPLLYFNQTILSSENLSLNGTEICTPCTNDNRCLKCVNESSCTLCSSGFYLSNGICLSSCPITTFADVSNCRNCSSSCLYCVSESICQVCSWSSFLYQEKCISSCPNLTIPMEITASVSNINSNTSISIKTKSCVSCESLFPNCLSCTNLSCTGCKPDYVMDYNGLCQVSCSSGYLNLNNKGFCIKCQLQCVGCSILLNNCSQCASGYILSVTEINGLSLRQCVSLCSLNQIPYQNQCTSCSAPCQTCTQTPTKCTSCIQTYLSQSNQSASQSYYLFNNTCITECPEHFYGFQNGCVQCDVSCQSCSREGCLRCAAGYFSSAPFTVSESSNPSTRYYNCYSSCPANLPFVTESNVCTKCSQNCLSCNSEKCLQCETGYYIYGEYCVIECPLPLVNYSKSCVNSSDIPVVPVDPVDPVTPSTPTDTAVDKSYFSLPVPFCLGLSVLLLLCLLSKCQYPQTHLSISFYALGSTLCISSLVFYLVKFLLKASSLEIPTILLLIALILNYISNFVFIVLSKFTILSDFEIQKLTKARRQYRAAMVILATVFTHSSYILFFSRLFDFSVFKLYVSNINCLRILNYLWPGQVLVYLVACIAGILKLLNTNRSNYTFSQTLQHFYDCLDLIALCFTMLLFSILNFKKPKSVYLKEQDWISTQSTKKVIFQNSSNEQFANQSSQSREEFNICEKNFRIANEDMLNDQLIFPEESGHKFSISSRNQDNYDNLFVHDFSLVSEHQNDHEKFAKTRDQLIVISNNQSEEDMKRKQVVDKFALSKTIDVLVRDEDMAQNLEEMKTINKSEHDLEVQMPTFVSSFIEEIPKQSEFPVQEQEDQKVFSPVIFNQVIEIDEDEVSKDLEEKQPEETTRLDIQKAEIQQIEGEQQNEASLSQVIQQQEEQQVIVVPQQEQQKDVPQFILQNQKSLLQDQNQAHELGSIQDEKTAVGFSLYQNQPQHQPKDHQTLPQLNQTLSNIDQIHPQNPQTHNSFIKNTKQSGSPERRSIDSPQLSPSLKNSPKFHSKNYQSSPKLNQVLSSNLINSKLSQNSRSPSNTSIKQNREQKSRSAYKEKIEQKKQKRKAKRYEKKEKKQVFIPGQLFATQRQLSKLSPNPRISGIYTLFESASNLGQNQQPQVQQTTIHHPLEQIVTDFEQTDEHKDIQIENDQNSQLEHEKYDNDQIEDDVNFGGTVLSPQTTLQLNLQLKNVQNNPTHPQIKSDSVNLSIDLIRTKNSIYLNPNERDDSHIQQPINKLESYIKFYLQDDTINQITEANDQRKSKSFSPNSFKRKQSTKKPSKLINNSAFKIEKTKHNQEKHHDSTVNSKQKTKILEQKRKSSSSLVKQPQFEMINYNKKKGKKQEERKEGQSGVYSILSEIERKKKIKSREKKLSSIYANKNM